MNTELIRTLAIVMVIMGMIVVPSQVNIVQTLKKNGFNASIFLFLFSDLRKYRKLMKNENDSKTRNLMKITYFGYIIPAILGILCFFLIILTIIVIY
jgi:hypothetical protein